MASSAARAGSFVDASRLIHALADYSAAQWLVRKTPLRLMSRRFVPGEDVESLIQAVRAAAQSGLFITANYLGEEEKTQQAAEAAAAVYHDLLDRIASEQLPAGISLKFSQLGQAIGDEVLLQNLEPLLQKSEKAGVLLRFDMESSAYTQRTLTAFEELWDKGWRRIGIVLQAYLRRTEADIARMNELGAGVRLCKGAYDEGADVAFQDPQEVNDNFVRCMKLLVAEGNYPGIATHDEEMIQATKSFVEENGIDRNRFEFQMLYGVRRDLQQQLVAEGYNVRVYIPFGESWYPYLMRRLAERPANLWFLLGSLFKESPFGRSG